LLFHLARLVETLIMPASAGCLSVFAGLAVSWRRPSLGRALIAVGLGLLWMLGSPALASRLVAPLERIYPVPAPAVRAEAVIVLAGTVDLSRSTSGRIEFYDRPERIIEGARLVKEGRARWLVISGRSGDPLRMDASESRLLGRFAQEYGVPAASILLEEESQTTAENASFTARMLRERGVRTAFLVTSGFHMPRSMACFRKAGLSPIAYPVDFRATPPRPIVAGFVPSGSALALSTLALHEYLGYATYWVRGRL
jgi:uncharacterized SAM-binding protein YcdF (DUF218 family)